MSTDVILIMDIQKLLCGYFFLTAKCHKQTLLIFPISNSENEELVLISIFSARAVLTIM